MMIVNNHYDFYPRGFFLVRLAKTEMCVCERSLSDLVYRRVSRPNYGITHELV